jgi:chromosome segregation ATPase
MSGCVSEQWVRGYVQHELAGVKDVVSEETYPLEKAITDLKTQMATLSVRLKEVEDGLNAHKETLTDGGEKWKNVEEKVYKLGRDLISLERELERLQQALQKFYQDRPELLQGSR